MPTDQSKLDLRRFGTFEGVFLPALLSILGVIMYLRLGWVVGNVGIGGALLIIALANSITIATGLSVSSLATNIRVERGGAYSIIAKSLGIEAGGAIGIPLYLAQTLSTVFYILGFTEGVYMFIPPDSPLQDPTHRILVSLLVWLCLQFLCNRSTKLTLKLQYVIVLMIAASLVSLFLGSGEQITEVKLWGSSANGDASFWSVYAIFFPAVTGILAGIGMSGELKSPKKSLPLGTLSAIFVSLIVYVVLCFWLIYVATPDQLKDTSRVLMVDIARWKYLLIGGILGATLSSALGALLAAPRLIEALGEHRILPFSSFFTKRSASGEPQNAVLFTGLIIGAGIVFGSLDTIAGLLTIFFLLTYGMLNLVVFIEDSIGVASFRPTFRVPRIVPLMGCIGCGLMMYFINPGAFLIAIVSTISIYLYLMRRGLEAPFGDVRAGLFTALAEWFARIVAKLPDHHRSWQPKLLVPVGRPKDSRADLLLARDIAAPGGSITAFNITTHDREAMQGELDHLLKSVHAERVFTSSIVASAPDFATGATVLTQVVRSMAVRPNTIFFTISADPSNDDAIRSIVAVAKGEQLGAIVLARHPKTAFGLQRSIRVWLHEMSPDWNFENSPRNWNLALLVAIRISRRWQSIIQIITVVEEPSQLDSARQFLSSLSEKARLPYDTTFEAVEGKFFDAVQNLPHVDLNIFGVGENFDLTSFRSIVDESGASCLFVRDSGFESAIDL